MLYVKNTSCILLSVHKVPCSLRMTEHIQFGVHLQGKSDCLSISLDHRWQTLGMPCQRMENVFSPVEEEK